MCTPAGRSSATISPTRLLVGGVGVGVDQRHGHRLTPAAASRSATCLTDASSSCRQISPRGADAFVDLKTQPARHQRSGRRVLQVVEHRNAQAAHFQHVAETARW